MIYELRGHLTHSSNYNVRDELFSQIVRRVWSRCSAAQAFDADVRPLQKWASHDSPHANPVSFDYSA